VYGFHQFLFGLVRLCLESLDVFHDCLIALLVDKVSYVHTVKDSLVLKLVPYLPPEIRYGASFE
jgi:hypothetical protein